MITEDQTVFDALIKIAPYAYKQKRTFFDISRTQSNEVIISRWYQYYLNPIEDHGLGNLFLDTLMEILGNPFKLTSFSAHLEQITKKGNFIDILVTGRGADKGKFIIIENKIHHHINNDLQDYWDHCLCTDDKKIGILLTLKTTGKYHEKFKNVLHIKWLSKVMNSIENGSYVLTTEQKFLLNNFYSAIENLNRYTTMNEQAIFYLNNTEEINRFISFKEDAIKYITTQLEEVSFKLNMKLHQKDSPRLRDLVLPGFEEELTCLIIFDKVFEPGNELRIVIGLAPKNLHRWQELDERFADKLDKNSFEVNAKKGVGFHNYLTKRYKLNEEICKQLSGYLTEEITGYILPIAREIGLYLKKEAPMSINES